MNVRVLALVLQISILIAVCISSYVQIQFNAAALARFNALEQRIAALEAAQEKP
jgi:hypothetical protein